MKILVFQHVPVEHPGVFREFWAKDGHVYDAVEFDAGDRIPDLSGYDLLAVMGGPMDVWQEDTCPWLVPEKAAIRHWVLDLDRPFLGICLGHQLLGEALGGKVTPMARPEVGIAEVKLTEAGLRDPILADFDGRIETFQWHGAEISTMPPGAVVLASNDMCATQAIRWGRWAYGFQYHCEIVASTVDDWQRIPEYQASLERALGADEAASLESVVSAKLQSFRVAAERLNRNLFAIMQQCVLAATK